ncbi:pentapeptide MXKDX repeat protein [Burkholderia pseudomallei]|uniref:pentapeptide MXKDX repeat protein n=1 Tax=Burkholderia pseudomallei TaxID=28450 RepID=UPI00050F2727|nr:pentapeptide MXKDX repeat protein [Burkholderia pseudomallei]KGC59090.1 pentapeptide MXKDX repeat family protein [Burkholderia pseudomallei]
MKRNLIAFACVAGFALAAPFAHAQNDAMSKDGMGMSKDAMSGDAMSKDRMGKRHDHMAKGGMKAGPMSKDAMKEPMSSDKMSPMSN